MSLATGGRAIGATSTRSSSESWASCRAVSILTIPTCSPAGPTRRTSGTRMRSLIRGSVLICPPGVVVLWSCCGSYGALAERDGRRIHHRRERVLARRAKTLNTTATGGDAGSDGPTRPLASPPGGGGSRTGGRSGLRLWIRRGRQIGRSRCYHRRDRTGMVERCSRRLGNGLGARAYSAALARGVGHGYGPAELAVAQLDEAVPHRERVEHLTVDRQRVRAGDVDEHRVDRLGPGGLRGEVQRDRDRPRVGPPGLERVEAGEREQRAPPVRRLQHHHRHVGLLVGGEAVRAPGADAG